MLCSLNKFELRDLYGKIEYQSGDKRTSHSAYEVGKRCEIILSVPRYLGALSTEIYAISDASKTEYVISGEWISVIGESDVYSFDLTPLYLPVGLYFYKVKISSYNREFYCIKDEFSVKFSETSKDSLPFQFTVSDFKYDFPRSHLGGIIYHIFVDRFMRTDNVTRSDDSVLVDDWSCGIPEYPEYPGAPLKNNTFYGGTIFGIIEKLDYFHSLGVTLIYLSPIFSSVSNHKYDTADYMKVDEGFGGDEAFIKLINEARARGIGIIIDGVFNHTGADSIYFNKYNKYGSLGAYQSKESPYYTWYDFKSYPDDYTSWWGIEILPRINTDISRCRDYFISDDGVIAKYSALGISGIRLDVADELSDSFIADIKRVMSKYNRESLLYGEVWEDASNKVAYGKRKSYYQGSELDGVMNYPLRNGIIDFLRNKQKDSLKYALYEILYNAPERIADLQMNVIGTHDTERILTVLAGKDGSGYNNSQKRDLRLDREEYAKAKKLLKQAYTILATLPGIPTIYYGDEAGLEGYGDPFNRLPYPWGREDLEILEHYRTTGKIRRENSVYKEGSIKIHILENDLLIFSRSDNKKQLFTVVNNSDKKLFMSFSSRVCLEYSKAEYESESLIEIPECECEIISSNIKTRLTVY